MLPRVPHVLVLNTGSSSLKWVVLDAESEAVVDSGGASWQGDDYATEILSALGNVPPVQAVTHRVVHGGARFSRAVVIDDQVRAAIAELAELAPLHNPPAVVGIDAARKTFSDVPHVACFDTSFHATLPRPAALYAVPWEWTERWGVRRFGFHGLSVEYAAQRVVELFGSRPARLVVAHLGAGCSVTAVLDGQSIDTSMGFTPLEGLMMGRRAGSIDPGIVLYLLRSMGLSAEQLEHALNFDAGLLGVSGVSADVREIVAAGTDRANLALDMFVHRAAACIGSMIAALNGLDALVFTAGIGEHAARLRAAIAARFDFLGLRLDASANEHASGDAEISAQGAAVRTFVLTAREDLTVLRQTRALLWPRG